MNNSHADPNVSLGLNILEGVRTSQVELNQKPFGLDIHKSNVRDLLAGAFMTADSLRNVGAVGVYYHMSMLYYANQADLGKLPKYWDSTRMLHLLPKFATKYSKAGEYPLLKVFREDKLRGKLVAKYGSVVTEKFGKPLSFVPDIDSYWLGDGIDVFGELKEQIKDLMSLADIGEYVLPFPANPDRFDTWLRNTLTVEGDPVMAAMCYLVMFFPHRVSSLAFGKGSTNSARLMWLLGDEQDMASQNLLALLKYGPPAIREWISIKSVV